MSDLLNPLELVPILILIGEVVATGYLSRRRVKRRLSWVLGSYLVFVVAAVAFAIFVPDEFGFSFIPALFITGPWSWVLAKLPGSLLTKLPPSLAGNHYGIFPLGALLNCVLFYLIDRLSYSKHDTEVSGRYAT